MGNYRKYFIGSKSKPSWPGRFMAITVTMFFIIIPSFVLGGDVVTPTANSGEKAPVTLTGLRGMETAMVVSVQGRSVQQTASEGAIDNGEESIQETPTPLNPPEGKTETTRWMVLDLIFSMLTVTACCLLTIFNCIARRRADDLYFEEDANYIHFIKAKNSAWTAASYALALFSMLLFFLGEDMGGRMEFAAVDSLWFMLIFTVQILLVYPSIRNIARTLAAEGGWDSE